MNILPKGTVTVIMATIIASFLILFFGNSVADSAEKKVEEVSSQAKPEIIEAKGGKLLESSSAAVKVLSPPPPGPFTLEKPVGITKAKLVLPSNTKVAAPTLKKAKPVKPMVLQEIEFKRMQPSMPVSPTKRDMPKPKLATMDQHLSKQLPELKKPELIMEIPKAPVTPEKVKGAGVEVSKPVLTAKVSVSAPTPVDSTVVAPSRPINSKPEPSEPIWAMRPPISPTMPLSRRMPQQQFQHGANQPLVPIWPRNMMQPPKSNQQYIYVPMPVYPASFVSPQMPLNNNYRHPFSGNRIKSQVGSTGLGMPMNIPALETSDTIEKSK